MTAELCLACHYLMKGKSSPTDQEWCGWMGGTPEPGNPERCHFRLMNRSELLKGLVIARSGRIVNAEDLSAENETFEDGAG